MDLLNRAYSQLYDLYRSMTPGSRLATVLFAVVVLLGGGYLLTHQAAVPEVDLLNGAPVTAGQLTAIETAFAKANLQGHKVRAGSVYVPSDQKATYMAALDDAKALPAELGFALRDAIDAGSMFDSGSQRDQRMIVAKQRELARAICLMQGIEQAGVIVDIDSSPRGFKDKILTAVATVKPEGQAKLSKSQVLTIRMMVARAFAGLKPENVAIADLNGRTWDGNSDEGLRPDDNFYYSLKQTYEQDLKTKILNALRFIPNVTVAVTVELTSERIDRTEYSRKTGREGDALESSRQHPNTAAILSSLLGKAHDDQKTDETETVSAKRAEAQEAGFTPMLAKVSVGVPNSYFKRIWRQRNAAESNGFAAVLDQAALDRIRDEESENIRKHVAPLLPSSRDAAKTAELVTVTTFEDMPLQRTSEPGLRETMLNWGWQSWALLGAVTAALTGLIVLRPGIRSRTAAVDSPTTPVPSESDEQMLDDRLGTIPSPHATRFHDRSPSLRDEVSELVENDPDAAANILRNWIGQVG